LISRQEWHPFTISSSPDQEYLTFHIRIVGDWTRALADTFNPGRKETLVIDKPYGPDGKTRLLRIDGPFGTSAGF
jgi:predicted ferric reductase